MSIQGDPIKENTNNQNETQQENINIDVPSKENTDLENSQDDKSSQYNLNLCDEQSKLSMPEEEKKSQILSDEEKAKENGAQINNANSDHNINEINQKIINTKHSIPIKHNYTMECH